MTTASNVETPEMTANLPFAMEPQDIELLREAHYHLEHPSLAARLSSVVGTPIDIAMQLLPKRWYNGLHSATEAAIHKALTAAVSSMRREHEVNAHEGLYRALAAGTGAVGGFFGFAGLAVELPITTTLMLRTIAEIARDEGEDIHSPESQRACVEVFAFGGRTEMDDAAETGYYGVRLALAAYIGNQAVAAGETVAITARVVHAVAHRLGMPLSQRAAAHLVPAVGAVTAAAVNTIFMHHFQTMARGHFRVRHLERKYGPEIIRSNYESFG